MLWIFHLKAPILFLKKKKKKSSHHYFFILSFFCLSWFTEPLSFFKCYSENKNLYCSPLHFRTYWSTTCMRKERELCLISRSGYRIRICNAICEFPFQNPFTEERRRNIYIGCQSKKVEIIYVPHLGTIQAYCTTGLW